MPIKINFPCTIKSCEGKFDLKLRRERIDYKNLLLAALIIFVIDIAVRKIRLKDIFAWINFLETPKGIHWRRFLLI